MDKMLKESDLEPRIHARVPCDVVIRDRQFAATTRNISQEGLYLRISEDRLEGVPLSLGTRVVLHLYLPRLGEILTFGAEVRWIKPDDTDADGRRVTGLGLKVQDGDEDSRGKLRKFVAEFRYAILALSDEEEPLPAFVTALQQKYQLLRAESETDLLTHLQGQHIALIVMSQERLERTDLKTLRRWGDRAPFSHALIIGNTGRAEPYHSKEFITLGKIFHFVQSTIEQREFFGIVDRAVEAFVSQQEKDLDRQHLEQANQQLLREITLLRKRAGRAGELGGIIGSSPPLLRLLNEVKTIAKTDITVHIRGETGTGKELIARALHSESPRKGGPFIPQNCAGMTSTLIESTLFGHRKGAFTGAVRDHEGAFCRANDGVLFLDEVGELPESIQTSLLRVLEDGIVTPLGDTVSRKVDVRILSATNKDLKKEVEAGRFRQDLYYRLVVAEVWLPPLRERSADIPLLVWHFYAQFCERHGKQPGGISRELLALLEGHDWPGNVRELENTIERLVAVAQNGQPITPELLPERFAAIARACPDSPPRPGRPDREAVVEQWLQEALQKHGTLKSTLEGVEKKIVQAALEKHRGNITRAARDLGLPRQTLQSSLKRLGLLDPG